MKLPLSLIKSFIQVDLPPEKIGEILTLLGIEVDAIENGHPSFAKVVIGEVLSVKKHPDAKNLQIAEVSDGKATYTVVCGAPNCRAGMKTAFAKVGAVLTDADGKQRRIEPTTIRGVESSGMLCSGSELRLSDNHDGILDLPYDMKTGEDAVHLLWDPVFEISLTPNLGHCMSALGIARELSASLKIPYKRPAAEKYSVSPFTVTVQDHALCPRYMCLLIEDVLVGPSPYWLKTQLEACGQKSINNIVDATNYIMMKLGHPMHAFDADKIEGSIHVGPAKSAFAFLGLDGVEREAPPGALLISDSKKPIALAGVMGGANSAVSDGTQRILLEAACFNPISVRVTSRKAGIRTESSQRFEKRVDPVGVEVALSEAAKLIGGKIVGFTDVKKEPFHPRSISYRPQRINQILGTKLSETEIEEIFERLGIQAENGKAAIPTYRGDLNEEIDLVEEVARVYGYNNIEKDIPYCSTSVIPNDPIFLFEREIRTRLTQAGLTEFLTCDLISPALGEISKEIAPFAQLKTIYSKSEEFSVLRTSLLPGLLQVVKGNFAQKNQTIAAFEIGRIHFLQETKVNEIPMAAILLTGHREPQNWSRKPSEVDFFDLKGIIENLVAADFQPSRNMSMHPNRQCDIHIDDLIIGTFGEVHPRLLEKFGIDKRIYYAEINLINLLKKKRTHLKMAPLPQFPASERDLTLPLPLKLPIEEIFEAIHAQKSTLLEKAELIDLYHPEGLEVKNATFRFVYRDPLKTISSEEADGEHAKIVKLLSIKASMPEHNK
ncbi:MAG: phenylalanine--tRNA ligase subunit beta [Parachlamydiales bacterium]|nr:phenylalanine--tRNA ligase subunit beta [Parachlamydiales bacterium]